jgi:hypothetical protein
MFNFKKSKRKVEKLFDFSLSEKPKPVRKSGSKTLDNKVNKALKVSGGNCVACKKRSRVGSSLFCRKCHI